MDNKILVPNKDDIGKYVKFRSLTRWNSVTATRKIRDVTDNGYIVVYFGGWDNFKIRPHEIQEIFSAK